VHATASSLARPPSQSSSAPFPKNGLTGASPATPFNGTVRASHRGAAPTPHAPGLLHLPEDSDVGEGTVMEAPKSAIPSLAPRYAPVPTSTKAPEPEKKKAAPRK